LFVSILLIGQPSFLRSSKTARNWNSWCVNSLKRETSISTYYFAQTYANSSDVSIPLNGKHLFLLLALILKDIENIVCQFP